MLKLANSIHTRGKLIQIMLIFFIIGITIIWCHSFTKLTDVGGKIHNRFAFKHFTLLCIFLSTLLLIVYPLQAASDDPTNEFINILCNSSEGGSNGDDP
jgi:hypothetical protein